MRNGFTLLELMLVVAVLAILVSIGVPSFRTIMADNLASSASNELFYALQVARSEAVKRNVMVSLCPSSNQLTCSGNGSWHLGWIVFIDTDNNGSRSSTEEIIRVQNAFNPILTLTGPTAVQYSTGGYLEPATLTSIQASVSGSTNSRWVCLTAIGRADVQEASC